VDDDDDDVMTVGKLIGLLSEYSKLIGLLSEYSNSTPVTAGRIDERTDIAATVLAVCPCYDSVSRMTQNPRPPQRLMIAYEEVQGSDL
jgi:hypothetical protein